MVLQSMKWIDLREIPHFNSETYAVQGLLVGFVMEVVTGSK